MAKLTWMRIRRAVSEEGTTVTYATAEEVGYTIESRKRHIPHANGEGFWDHTTYWVLKDGKEVIERYSLKDAKEYAEELWAGQNGAKEP